MFKGILLILLIFLTLPVKAGVYEDSIKSNTNTFLYLYTPNCGYCTRFNPIFNKVATEYAGNCKFLKIDAQSNYGQTLASSMKIAYVPYVIVVNNKKQTVNRISPQCLLNYACVKDAVDKCIK